MTKNERMIRVAVPKYNELYNVVLKFLADGEVHSMKDCRDFVKHEMQLTDEDISERLSSGQAKWLNNLSWACTYLRKAGMISSPERAHNQITDAGRQLLDEGIIVTNEILRQRAYVAMSNFVNHNGSTIDSSGATAVVFNDTNETPEEILERVHSEINAELSDELLSLLIENSPQFFEKFTVKLMECMGYGIGEETRYSGDGGIDGIVYGDKLGFDRIGIQAKRWDTNQVVGTPEIQKFYGALDSPEYGKIDKGLFVTTAKFSAGAKKYAATHHIILIDGKRLAELMIEFDVGVSTQKVYKIKRVDTDFFSDT